jgi:hypothetical protein
MHIALGCKLMFALNSCETIESVGVSVRVREVNFTRTTQCHYDTCHSTRDRKEQICANLDDEHPTQLTLRKTIKILIA